MPSGDLVATRKLLQTHMERTEYEVSYLRSRRRHLECAVLSTANGRIYPIDQCDRDERNETAQGGFVDADIGMIREETKLNDTVVHMQE